MINSTYNLSKGDWMSFDPNKNSSNKVEAKLYSRAYNELLVNHPSPPSELMEKFTTSKRVSRNRYSDSWDILCFRHNTYTFDFLNYRYIWNRYFRQSKFKDVALAVYILYDAGNIGNIPVSQLKNWESKIIPYTDYLRNLGFRSLRQEELNVRGRTKTKSSLIVKNGRAIVTFEEEQLTEDYFWWYKIP